MKTYNLISLETGKIHKVIKANNQAAAIEISEKSGYYMDDYMIELKEETENHRKLQTRWWELQTLVLLISILFASCATQKPFPHVYQQRGVLRQTDNGTIFYPISDWEDYQPGANGDTVTRYSLIKPK